jgi:hypothetical protein
MNDPLSEEQKARLTKFQEVQVGLSIEDTKILPILLFSMLTEDMQKEFLKEIAELKVTTPEYAN